MAQIDKKISTPNENTLQNQPVELVRYLKDLNEVLSRYSMKLGDIINKGLRITDNFDSQIVTVTTSGADTEVIVPHTLKRVPNGYFVLNTNKAANIYDSGTTWTTTNIYIKSNAATTTVKMLIL